MKLIRYASWDAFKHLLNIAIANGAQPKNFYFYKLTFVTQWFCKINIDHLLIFIFHWNYASGIKFVGFHHW